jgi:nicotinamide-nucleotide amidase
MTFTFERLAEDAARLLELCRQSRLTIATGESCTGGLIIGILTEVPGSSDVVDRGFVTYSNEAKADMLGVASDLIARHGAVSEEVARAMAAGLMSNTPADLCVAVTGIAGPGGGTADKPVGLVHLAAGRRDMPIVHERRIFRDLGRNHIRLATVDAAFGLLSRLAGDQGKGA